MAFTAKTVKQSPADFVDQAVNSGFACENYLSTTNKWEDRFQPIHIGNYLCGNRGMSAANSANFDRASTFWQATIVPPLANPYGAIMNPHPKPPDPKNSKPPVPLGPTFQVTSILKHYGLEVKGQGYPEDFVTLLEVIWYNREKLAKNPNVKKYFEQPTFRAFLDLIESDNIVGCDCIGFVHQYLYFVGVVDAYLGYSARGYMTQFKPIKSLDEIEPLCVCAWSNDSHLVIIDRVVSREPGKVIIDLAQSSGAVKVTKMVTVTAHGTFDDIKDASGKVQPLVVWMSNVGNPAQFYLAGDVPRDPRVMIGKLPGLKLAKGEVMP